MLANPRKNSAEKGLQGKFWAFIDQIEGYGLRGLQPVWTDLGNLFHICPFYACLALLSAYTTPPL